MNEIGNCDNETDNYNEGARDNPDDKYIDDELLIMTILMIGWPLYSKLKMQLFPQKYWSFYSYSSIKTISFFSFECKSYKKLPLSI